TYSLKDSRGNEVLKGAAQVNALGGFNAAFKLPPTMNLGYANLQLEARDVSVALSNLTFNHQVQVQEFRRPEFEVTAQASDGPHSLRIDFLSVEPPRPSTVTAEASVMDVNRQQWTATTSMLVHPADLYVGVRSPRTFVQKGEPLIVQAIACDLDGKLIAGRSI